MEVSNIIASLRRNKLSAALVIVQIALAMAIVSNAVFVIVMRNAQARQPSGLDEQNIFTITTRLVSGGAEAQQTQNLSLTELDLQAVRMTPGVIDAYVAESLPLVGRYETSPIARTLADVENNAGIP